MPPFWRIFARVLLNSHHLTLLGCPSCRAGLALAPLEEALLCQGCGRAYPSVNGIFDAVLPDRLSEAVSSAADHFEGLWGTIYSAGATKPVVRAPYLSSLLGVRDARFAQTVTRFCAGAMGPLLDVPVGSGAFLDAYRWPEVDVIGVDLSMRMLARAGRRARRLGVSRLTLLRSDVAALPLRDGSVRRIVSVNGLHCFPHRRDALDDLRRCLRDDGDFVGVTLLPGRLSRADRVMAHAHRIGMFGPPTEEKDLVRMARDAGFSKYEGEHEGAMLLFRFSP